MADGDAQEEGQQHGSVYRVAGALTITRAATTQREIDALPDPLTIDLSQVERMDTVGAWIIYRTVRDRKAKVIGGGEIENSLVDQVAEYDVPVRVRPEQRPGLVRILTELGEWVAEAGQTFVGLLCWLNVQGCQTLIGDGAPATLAELARHPAVREHVRRGLAQWNEAHPASSERIARAILLSEPPSIDAGEITDKGYINQHAVLTRRAEAVTKLNEASCAEWIGCA